MNGPIKVIPFAAGRRAPYRFSPLQVLLYVVVNLAGWAGIGFLVWRLARMF